MKASHQHPVLTVVRRPTHSDAPWDERADEGETSTIRPRAGTYGSWSREHSLGARKVKTIQSTVHGLSHNPSEQPSVIKGWPQEQQVFQPSCQWRIDPEVGSERPDCWITLLQLPRSTSLPYPKRFNSRSSQKKFFTLIFNYYSEVNDPVQYIRHFQDKMVIYARND